MCGEENIIQLMDKNINVECETIDNFMERLSSAPYLIN
jgi:hypothetical protein